MEKAHWCSGPNVYYCLFLLLRIFSWHCLSVLFISPTGRYLKYSRTWRIIIIIYNNVLDHVLSFAFVNLIIKINSLFIIVIFQRPAESSPTTHL